MCWHHHVVRLEVIILVAKARVFLIYLKHIITISRIMIYLSKKKTTSCHTNYSFKTMTSHDISMAFATT